MERKLLYISLFAILIIGLVLLSSCGAFRSDLQVQDTDDAKDILEKGRILYAEYRDYSDAIETYLQVLERFPDDSDSCAWAYYEIGLSYYRMKDFDEADMYFDIVLENYPEESSQVTLSRHLQFKIDTGITAHNATYQDEELNITADIGFRLDTDAAENEDEFADE